MYFDLHSLKCTAKKHQMTGSAVLYYIVALFFKLRHKQAHVKCLPLVVLFGVAAWSSGACAMSRLAVTLSDVMATKQAGLSRIYIEYFK